ncbi:MAG: hypothetical protein ACYCZI_09310 [Metallibacterium scheffleri]
MHVDAGAGALVMHPDPTLRVVRADGIGPLRACEKFRVVRNVSSARPAQVRTRLRESATCVTASRAAIHGRAERLKNSQPLSTR